jgi:hypothetical protein
LVLLVEDGFARQSGRRWRYGLSGTDLRPAFSRVSLQPSSRLEGTV